MLLKILFLLLPIFSFAADTVVESQGTNKVVVKTSGVTRMEFDRLGNIKFNALTATCVPYIDAFKNILCHPSISTTELVALNGITSNIQAQIDAIVAGSPTTSAGLAAAISDETGTAGALVFSISPILVTPNLGTPSALVGTNITGTGASFRAGTATALFANGTNCSAGQYGLGVDASGNVESCAAITVLGTIVTGIWNGTAIPAQYGGTGGDSSAQTGLPRVNSGTWTYDGLLDEDNFASDSAVKAPSQQSTKAYVDASVVASSSTEPHLLQNAGLSITMAANAVTVALKQSDGTTDPSTGTAAVKVGFRNTTGTTGGYTVRTITAALSMTIDSDATMGTTSALAKRIYIYAMDNAGTVVLAASGTLFPEATLKTSTTLDTSADLIHVLYSDSGLTTKPIVLLGSFVSTQATAGTWVTAASEVYVGQRVLSPNIYVEYSGSGDTSLAGAGTPERWRPDTLVYDPFSMVATGASWLFTAQWDMICNVVFSARHSDASSILYGAGGILGAIAYKNAVDTGQTCRWVANVAESASTAHSLNCAFIFNLNSGDTAYFEIIQNSGETATLFNTADSHTTFNCTAR